MSKVLQHFYVYIVRCSDTTLYTGMTRDIEKRLQMHNGEMAGGARYTRSRRPVHLAYFEVHSSQSAAMRREREIKKLSKKKKEALVQSTNELLEKSHKMSL
ncbi:MAG: GIY-YIG nuclease family protein [Actinobacteria bacterium]|nr:GIY-YIG nuclease family protein [Actinomycetota bacterium]